MFLVPSQLFSLIVRGGSLNVTAKKVTTSLMQLQEKTPKRIINATRKPLVQPIMEYGSCMERAHSTQKTQTIAGPEKSGAVHEGSLYSVIKSLVLCTTMLVGILQQQLMQSKGS